jgi:hypothetical protein
LRKVSWANALALLWVLGYGPFLNNDMQPAAVSCSVVVQGRVLKAMFPSTYLTCVCYIDCAFLQAVMVEKEKPAVTPGGMTAGGMPAGMTL